MSKPLLILFLSDDMKKLTFCERSKACSKSWKALPLDRKELYNKKGISKNIPDNKKIQKLINRMQRDVRIYCHTININMYVGAKYISVCLEALQSAFNAMLDGHDLISISFV